MDWNFTDVAVRPTSILIEPTTYKELKFPTFSISFVFLSLLTYSPTCDILFIWEKRNSVFEAMNRRLTPKGRPGVKCAKTTDSENTGKTILKRCVSIGAIARFGVSTKSLANDGKFNSISKTASVSVVESPSIPPSGKRNLVLTTTTRQESFVVYCVTPAIAGLGC